MIRIALVIAAVACGARPQPAEPIAGKAVPSEVKATPLTPLPAIGQERVEFEPNATDVSTAGAAVLDGLVERLRASPAQALQISGHTDPSERDAHNTSPGGLSDARANAVRDYLVAHGIAERRLLVRAVGDTEARTNGTNRRVEFERATIKEKPFGGGRVVVIDTEVEILDVVTFQPDKDVITTTSFPILDAIAATLLRNPEIQLVEVQSHTDERGDATHNMQLTQARAVAVVTYLVGKGVDRARLSPQGYGSTQPLDRAHTEAAWAKNRRVAFLILKRSP